MTTTPSLAELLHDKTKTVRSDTLDGLRIIASLLVFIVHFGGLFLARSPDADVRSLSTLITYLSPHGSSILVVLSGYLTARSAERCSYLHFVRKRYTRLAPAYITMLAIYVAIYIMCPSRSRLPESIGQAVVYIGANVLMFPGLYSIQPIMTVSWTLSYIMLAAIVLPPMYRLLRMGAVSPPARSVFFAFLMLLLAAAGLHAASLLLLGALIENLRDPRGETGCARKLRAFITFRGAMSMVCWLIIASLLAPLKTVLIWVVLGTLLLTLVQWRRGPWSDEISRGLTQAGHRTYAFFLSHSLVLNVLLLCVPNQTTPSLLSTAAWFLLALTTAVIVACLLYEAVERRFAGSARTQEAISTLSRQYDPSVNWSFVKKLS